jgi:segregation and condensation protein A
MNGPAALSGMFDSAVAAPVLPPVQLEKFEGPLDVLLHLIRSQELEIFDIPIAMITSQYLDILNAQQDLDLEIAGDYLVMASTLMQLKSRLLLPRPEIDDEGNEIDPRAELAAQLIAYEQYRMLAEELNERPRIDRDVFTRSIFPEADEVERPLPEADLDALLMAFRTVLKRIGGEVRHHIFTDTISVREQMTAVLEQLQHGGIQLDEFLLANPGREVLVTTILAILELWRQQTIIVVQSESYASISLLPKKTVQ